MKREEIRKLVTNLIESVAALYEEKEDKEKEQVDEDGVLETRQPVKNNKKLVDRYENAIFNHVQELEDEGEYDFATEFENDYPRLASVLYDSSRDEVVFKLDKPLKEYTDDLDEIEMIFGYTFGPQNLDAAWDMAKKANCDGGDEIRIPANIVSKFVTVESKQEEKPEKKEQVEEARREKDSGFQLNTIVRGKGIDSAWWVTVSGAGDTSSLKPENCWLYPGKKVKPGTTKLWKRGQVRGLGVTITWPEYCFAIKNNDEIAIQKIVDLGLPLDLDKYFRELGTDYEDYFVDGVPEPLTEESFNEPIDDEFIEDESEEEFTYEPEEDGFEEDEPIEDESIEENKDSKDKSIEELEKESVE